MYIEIDPNYCLPLYLSYLPNISKVFYYMSVDQSIPLCSCGIFFGNEGAIFWDIPSFIKGFALVDPLSCLHDTSYDSKSLSHDT